MKRFVQLFVVFLGVMLLSIPVYGDFCCYCAQGGTDPDCANCTTGCPGSGGGGGPLLFKSPVEFGVPEIDAVFDLRGVILGLPPQMLRFEVEPTDELYAAWLGIVLSAIDQEQYSVAVQVLELMRNTLDGTLPENQLAFDDDDDDGNPCLAQADPTLDDLIIDPSLQQFLASRIDALIADLEALQAESAGNSDGDDDEGDDDGGDDAEDDDDGAGSGEPVIIGGKPITVVDRPTDLGPGIDGRPVLLYPTLDPQVVILAAPTPPGTVCAAPNPPFPPCYDTCGATPSCSNFLTNPLLCCQ